MIGYHGMVLDNMEFYWRRSFFLFRANGTWKPVRFSCIHYPEDSDTPMRGPVRVDNGDKAGYTMCFMDNQHNDIITACDEPFTSDDWITYRPYLGYIMPTPRNLFRLVARVPRSRNKGLVLEGDARNVIVAISLGPDSDYVHPSALVQGLCDRMNKGYATPQDVSRAVTERLPCLLGPELALYDNTVRYYDTTIGTIREDGGTLVVRYHDEVTESAHDKLFANYTMIGVNKESEA